MTKLTQDQIASVQRDYDFGNGLALATHTFKASENKQAQACLAIKTRKNQRKRHRLLVEDVVTIVQMALDYPDHFADVIEAAQRAEQLDVRVFEGEYQESLEWKPKAKAVKGDGGPPPLVGSVAPTAPAVKQAPPLVSQETISEEPVKIVPPQPKAEPVQTESPMARLRGLATKR